MKKWDIVEISRKGQLLIPKSYRVKAGIRPGVRVALAAEPRKLLVYVLPDDPIEAACGVLKGEPSLAKELLKERRDEGEEEEKKLRR
jgi:bifunctional DNA-binding transcriptional regulator/antitoxin component of YhaV-PrlF toxin-antitoxin module